MNVMAVTLYLNNLTHVVHLCYVFGDTCRLLYCAMECHVPLRQSETKRLELNQSPLHVTWVCVCGFRFMTILSYRHNISLQLIVGWNMYFILLGRSFIITLVKGVFDLQIDKIKNTTFS